MASRSTHARAILGQALYDQVVQSKILVVGAGGIGCELLKNVVLTGFGDVTLLDLDTIDLSNLNRQFLFRKKDIKQSKALTAAAAANQFNPNVKIIPIHGNIKDDQFDVAWFSRFGIVLNALDNLDARTHTNKMCMAAGVPLVESGTAGYLGQVQPIIKDTSECFSCNPHETPKSFPVCTIRSTPSQPIHCIVWAKSYLMSQLFAEDEDALGSSELDDALKNGENAQEIATLKAETQAFSKVRSLLREPGRNGETGAARLVFEKIFDKDIRNLLSMEDMWRSRTPPTPLDWNGILNETFQAPPPASTSSTINSSAVPQKVISPTGQDAAKLKDQKPLSLRENLELFIDSTNRLSQRIRRMIVDASAGDTMAEPSISFDKDDPDTLDFVTAASNLRSIAYGIPTKTRWDVKEMAGNIIPAIATTNAIVAGLIVLQALQVLAGQSSSSSSFHQSKMRQTNLVSKAQEPIYSYSTGKPKANCGVCRDTYVTLSCDPTKATLGQVLRGVLGLEDDEEDLPEISTYEAARLLSDPDWDDNLPRTLDSLGVTRGKFLAIVDDSDGDDQGMVRGTIQLSIVALPPNHQESSFILPSPLPNPPRKPYAALKTDQQPPESPLKMTIHRKRPASGFHEPGEPATKKRRITPSIGLNSSPKKRMLEEDGLVILDGGDDTMEVEDPQVGDVIEID